VSGHILAPFALMSTVESIVEASDDRASSLLAPFPAALARATSDLEALSPLSLSRELQRAKRRGQPPRELSIPICAPRAVV